MKLVAFSLAPFNSISSNLGFFGPTVKLVAAMTGIADLRGSQKEEAKKAERVEVASAAARNATAAAVAAAAAAAAGNSTSAAPAVLRFPKIALLFLTRGALPHERLWKGFLENIPPGLVGASLHLFQPWALKH